MRRHFAPRRAIWTYPDRLRVKMMAVVLGGDVAYGLQFAFGGKAESVSQLLLRQALPAVPVMHLWGVLLAGSAAACWIGYAERGGIGCTLAWSILALTSLATIANGTAPSYGGPILFGLLAGIHIVISYGASSGLAKRAPVDTSDGE